MNDNVGPNAALGNISSRLVRPVRKFFNHEVGTAVCSTGELLRAIKDTNETLGGRVGTQQSQPSRPVRACSRADIQAEIY